MAPWGGILLLGPFDFSGSAVRAAVMTRSMWRAVCLLAVLSVPTWAHGGAFRPPPRSGPRDPVRGPANPNGPPATPGGRGPSTVSWEYWWTLNRERYLDIRARLARREVITGTKRSDREEERRLARETILIPEVLKALKDREDEVRAAAAVAAGKFGMTMAAPRLREMFARDKIRDVRESALLGLLLLRDQKQAGFLAEVALDQNERARMRGFAVLGLGYLKEATFLSDVLTGKKKVIGSSRTREQVRACAATALGLSGNPAMTPLLVAHARSRSTPRAMAGLAASALGPLGDPIAIGDVLSMLRTERVRDAARVGAATALGSLVQPSQQTTIELVGKLLDKERHPGVKSMLAISLGRIGGEHSERILIGQLKRVGQQLRAFVYLGLGISGSETAGAALHREFLRVKNGGDRSACALALGLADYRAAIPDLRRELKERHAMFAPYGMLALGLLNDLKTIPIIEKTLDKSRDPVTREKAAIGLALLRRSAAIDALIKVLAGSNSLYERAAVVRALGLIGSVKAVAPLRAIVHDKRRSGIERALALAGLGRIGDPEAVPVLTQLTFDFNPYVTVEAIQQAITIL